MLIQWVRLWCFVSNNLFFQVCGINSLLNLLKVSICQEQLKNGLLLVDGQTNIC